MKNPIHLCLASALLFATAQFAHPASNKGTGKFAEIDSLQIYYEIQGKGTPLVLLHGGMVTIETSFPKTRPVFNKQWKTIAIEMQGHGHTSDVPGRPLSIERIAENTYALLKQLNIEKADFFGWSMGGGVALQLAIKHPEMVRKVAFSGTGFRPEGMVEGQEKGMASLTPEMFPLEWRQEYEKKNPDPKGFPKLVNKIKEFSANWKGMKAEDFKSIQAPVLIMMGDADIIRPEHAVEMKRLLPNASLAILPMTDHFAPVQRPEWVASMVKTFLEAPMPGEKKDGNKGKSP